MCAFILKWSRQGSVCQRALLSAAVLVFAAAGAYAEDHVWSSLYGGSFNYWLNWVPNFVPGEDDNAIFELDMDPAYEVTFYEGVTNLRCIFRTDKVILNLGGCTYTLTNPGFGLIVGDDLGDVAQVLFYNGTIDTTVTHVGLWDDSDGTLDLESGLTLNISEHLLVGNDGDGLMNIHDGASVAAERAAMGGHDFGNTGVLSVDGANAEFTVNETLTVGDEGCGYLNLLNGAKAYPRNGYVGDGLTAYGEINITGESEMAVSEWLTLGRIGSGWLTVAEGGQLEVGDFHVGGETGGTGWADLMDADSRIDASAYVFVGSWGHGTMYVSQQAALTAETLLVGASETSEGELYISDADTSVTVQNNLVSGLYGVGTLNITGGADVRTTEPGGWIKIGDQAGSDGYVLVDDGSTLTAEQASLVVGDTGQAVLDILAGSQVHTAGDLIMGWGATGDGALMASDAGTTLTVGGNMWIGSGSAASCSVQAGAEASAYYLCIGAVDNADGDLTVTGENTIFSKTISTSARRRSATWPSKTRRRLA